MTNSQAASVESSLPRYTAWKHLHDKAQWPGAVPDWAKDYSGRMNDGVAAQAVIEELRAEVTHLAEQGAAPQAVPGREAAYKWAYEYLQSRMESIGRHGWAHDCDGEIEARPADADRAARVSPAEKTARMLTEAERVREIVKCWDNDDSTFEGLYAEAIQRKFCEVNAGCRIPADGKLGEGA